MINKNVCSVDKFQRFLHVLRFGARTVGILRLRGKYCTFSYFAEYICCLEMAATSTHRWRGWGPTLSTEHSSSRWDNISLTLFLSTSVYHRDRCLARCCLLSTTVHWATSSRSTASSTTSTPMTPSSVCLCMPTTLLTMLRVLDCCSPCLYR